MAEVRAFTKSVQKNKLTVARRNIIYTSLFNMIDYPAMVIPVHSAVDPKLDPVDEEYKPANDRDAEVQKQCGYNS